MSLKNFICCVIYSRLKVALTPFNIRSKYVHKRSVPILLYVLAIVLSYNIHQIIASYKLSNIATNYVKLFALTNNVKIKVAN